jgi:hypothetical protein
MVTPFIAPTTGALPPATKVDTLGIEPRASRMLSGCDTTTPRAHVTSSATLSKTPARLANGDCGSPTSLQLMRRLAFRFRRANHYSQIARLRGIDARETLSEWLRRWTRNTLGSARKGSNPLGITCMHVCGLHRNHSCVDVYDDFLNCTILRLPLFHDA